MSAMFEHCRAMMEAMMGGAGIGGMMPTGSMMGQPAVLVALAWLALPLVVAAAVGWLILRGRRRQGDGDPRLILDVRYARDELDRDTYLRMRADLSDGAAAAG